MCDPGLAAALEELFELKDVARVLQTCDQKSIMAVYMSILAEAGSLVEDIKVAPVSASDGFHKYCQMYKSVIMPINIYRAVKKLLEMIDVTLNLEFNLQDVLTPTPARTCYFLSVFANFFQSSLSCIQVINEQENLISERLEVKENINNEIAKNKQLVEKVKKEKAQNELEVNELNRTLDLRKQECASKLEEKKRLKEVLDEQKNEITFLKDQIRESELEIIQEKDELDRIGKDIFKACEREELEANQKVLAQCTADIAEQKELAKKSRQREKVLDSLQKLTDGRLIPGVNEIQELKNRNSKAEQELAEKQKELQASHTHLEELVAKIEQHGKTLNMLKQNKASLETSCERTAKGYREEIKQEKILLEEIQRHQEERDMVITDLQEEILKMQDEILICEQNKQGFENSVKHQYMRTLNELKVQDEKLLKQCAETCNTLQTDETIKG